MKKIMTLIVLLNTCLLFAQAPYPQNPSFETTPSGHYGTGLGIADINGDGWKDIIVANGNDIVRQHLVVYYNRGDGTFPADPDWESEDVDYHGHLAAGDIDNDGDVDIAVSVYIGPSGFGDPGKAKIYFNTGNELESTPSFETEEVYTFSCALGDADADGDLDLALACGEPYNSVYDQARVYLNNNGSFNTAADWLSTIQMAALDVEYGDVDQNGFLDLIYVCENGDNYVFLADNQGNIDQNPDWESDHPDNFMNSVDFGRPCQTSTVCMVATGNDQLGGDGKIKQFTFTPPIPSSSPPNWESNYVGYGSGILMAEINNDDNLDLLYGSWWGPLNILEGQCGFWDPLPIYTSDRTSVVEAILMSDLGKFNYQAVSPTIKALSERGVHYLDQQIIESINAVYVNGVLLDRSDYTYVELKNWISFKNNIMPGDVVKVEYEYMQDGDIVISNWDPGKGNFIYYNDNNPVGIEERALTDADLLIRRISPQPADTHIDVDINTTDNEPFVISIYDMNGRVMGSYEHMNGKSMTIDIRHLRQGMYVIMVSSGVSYASEKFHVAR